MTLFRLCLCVLAGLLMASGPPDNDLWGRSCKGTQSAIPAAPFKLRFKFNVGREHGCSHSMESLGEVGDLRIEVDKDNKAVLRLDLFQSRTFGPSPGDLGASERDFKHNDSRFRAVWTGKAERTGTDLVLKFSKKEYTHEEWGSDFKPQGTVESGLVLTCTSGTLLLDPPYDKPVQRPECAPVLFCRPSAPILTFKDEQVREMAAKLYYSGGLPFAPHPGLDADINTHYHSGWEHLRRASN